MLAGSHSREDLVQYLTHQYEIENRETAEKDVDEFLTELKGKSLIGDAL
ncbi:MAG: PqqD family protein [Polyangia bacterium]